MWLYFGVASNAEASHIRGGEITIERVRGNSLAIRCTLTVYTDTNSNVVDLDNELFFGDGSSQSSPRALVTPLLGKATNVNVYYFTHTYASPGQYLIFHFREFRNQPVLNIGPSPASVFFYVESQVLIAPGIDATIPNRSPVLLNPAVDIAGLGQVYLHNPAAFDADGDSLTYEIAESRTYVRSVGGSNIRDYQFPHIVAGGQDSARIGPARLTVDPFNGTMTWDVPRRLGEFNVAIKINEWRFGVLIGYVIRDIQIIVRDVENNRPFLILPRDTCIIAGTLLRDTIRARDPDSLDRIFLQTYGGVYTLPPPEPRAFFTPPNIPIVVQTQPARGVFTWPTGCLNVARQPYQVTFKAEDVPAPRRGSRVQPLVDFKVWGITVLGPPPELQTAVAGRGSISLNWAPYGCSNATEMQVYRRIDRGDSIADPCAVGVAVIPGYQLIGTVPISQTNFIDDDNGAGLARGKNYCYRLVAQFPQPRFGESKPSNALCASLLIDVPILTNVSIERTDPTAGETRIVWTSPFEIDSVAYPPPYRYELKRSLTGPAGPFTTIHRTTDLKDTIFIDQTAPTAERENVYRVVFGYGDSTQSNLRDSSSAGANPFIRAEGQPESIRLTWGAQVPWSLDGFYHVLYRSRDGVSFSILDSTQAFEYVDDGSRLPLDGGLTADYFYKVETRGSYRNPDLPEPLINFSYVTRGQLLDTIPPCPPTLVRSTPQGLNCDECRPGLAQVIANNRLTWEGVERDSCPADLDVYRIYYREHKSGPFRVVGQTRETTFSHSNAGSLAGCYYVVAVDSAGNESAVSDTVCQDNCITVRFPNIFTPDGDNLNAFFEPLCLYPPAIRQMELLVYSRWGKLVYQSTARSEFRWNGRLPDGSEAPVGTYFYRVNITTRRLDPARQQETLKGWVELARKR